MTSQFDYMPLSNSPDSDDISHLAKILEQCFVALSGQESTYIQMIGLDNFRLLRQGDPLVGGLAMIPMGQWFGGQRVPMTGIAAVGIAPEYRSSGAALSLMQQAVKELYAQAVPISVLYPAAQQLYRKVGYEQGGSFCGWEIKTGQIQIKERSLPVCAADPAQAEQFQTLYAQQAPHCPGHLDRHPALWHRILNADDTVVYAYGFGTAEQPEGYVIFTQERVDNQTVLQVRDWVLRSPAAVQTFWSFLNDHRSQIDQVHWRSSAIDPLSLGLSTQAPYLKFIERWMLRLIHVDKALSLRGYPAHLETELHLDVKDDLLPENSDRYILSVAQGRGEVTRGGRGDCKLSIRGLAPLYTGLFSPEQLYSMGYLDAPDSALAIATQIFAGSSPWMPDFF